MYSRFTLPNGVISFHLLTDSFPIPTYLLFKGSERLGRNDVIVKIAEGKVRTSLDAMRIKSFLGATGNECGWEVSTLSYNVLHLVLPQL